MAKIEIIEADITKLEVDAIVNAANRSLLGGGGVDGAIHRAAGPQLLASCYRECMALARVYEMRSIAFPAISCGAYGFPVSLAAEIAIGTISECLKDNPCLQTVYLVCFGDAVLKAYNEQFHQLMHDRQHYE